MQNTEEEMKQTRTRMLGRNAHDEQETPETALASSPLSQEECEQILQREMEGLPPLMSSLLDGLSPEKGGTRGGTDECSITLTLKELKEMINAAASAAVTRYAESAERDSASAARSGVRMDAGSSGREVGGRHRNM